MTTRAAAPPAIETKDRATFPAWAAYLVALVFTGGAAALGVLVFADNISLVLLIFVATVGLSAFIGGSGPASIPTLVGAAAGGTLLAGTEQPAAFAIAQLVAFGAAVGPIAGLSAARWRANRVHAAMVADTAARIAQGEQAARERADAAIATAIAEGKQRADAAINANEARLRALIAHSADAFVLLDGDGAVRFASPAASRLLDLDSERARGANLASFVHRKDAPHLRTVLAESGRATVRLWAGGDSWRWVAATGSDLRDDPAVRAVLVNLHDVTEQVRMAERDAFLCDAAQRLVAVGDDADVFAASAAVAVPRFAAGCAVELMGQNGALRRAFTALPPDLPPDAPDPFAAAGVSAHVVRALVTGRAATFAPAPDAPAAMLVAPLAARGKTLGAVTFVAGGRGPFDAADETTATLFAGYLALSLVSVHPQPVPTTPTR